MAEDYFAGPVAERYDSGLGEWGEPAAVAATADFLAELAGDGAALELAIGTGRVALPLAARGVAVHGIDLSVDMVAQLRAKPGGAEISCSGKGGFGCERCCDIAVFSREGPVPPRSAGHWPTVDDTIRQLRPQR